MFEPLRTLFLGARIDPPPGSPAEIADGSVELRCNSWIPWIGGVLARMNRPAAAVTLGNTIVIHEDAEVTFTLLAHELAHVRQWRKPLFPVLYAAATIRHGYWNNPYEIEARVYASEASPGQSDSERTA